MYNIIAKDNAHNIQYAGHALHGIHTSFTNECIDMQVERTECRVASVSSYVMEIQIE